MISIQAIEGAELVHYASADVLITSHANRITVTERGRTRVVRVPVAIWERALLWTRLTRRALRLDKCNVVPVWESGALVGVVVIRRGQVYRIDMNTGAIDKVLTLNGCRNVLHQSICTTESGRIVFGEYGRNTERGAVSVHQSCDGGRTWGVAFTFRPGEVRHVHGCFWDPYTKRVWICTGDSDTESLVMSMREDASDVIVHGRGAQTWRACHVMFRENEVIWGMDSQFEVSHVCRYVRATGEIRRGVALAGPVWYAKDLTDGMMLLATANELGVGVLDDAVHVYMSRDGNTWVEVLRREHDGWPKRIFKFGVVAFADGPQSSDEFYCFAEAVQGMDGRAFRCQIARAD